MPEVREVQVRAGDARRPEGHPAQPGEHLEVRSRAGLHRASDIDWSKPIPEIDQQLYAKYGLDSEEIAFIEAKVKPMGVRTVALPIRELIADPLDEVDQHPSRDHKDHGGCTSANSAGRCYELLTYSETGRKYRHPIGSSACSGFL